MSTWSELKNNPRLLKIYQTRCEILKLTREFFWSQGFIETDTPIAVRPPSQEPYLNFFPVTVTHPSGQTVGMHLRTSPEFALKKLLAAGLSKIFEIGKNFRNNEDFGGTHNPEFTLIEWYRAPGTYEDFMDDIENLFTYVGAKLQIENLKYKNFEIKINAPWERLSMKRVWKKYLDVHLDEYLEIANLKKLALARGHHVGEHDAYEDVFFKIFLNEIEPKLGLERPLFIYDYPAQMASLSRLCKNDPRYAERVELYIGGLEMCNGFGELTDAAEQRKRLEADKALRAKLGKETWPIDQDFINALAGLPAEAPGGAKVGGVAMGMDRMVVLFTGAKDINEVIFGSVKDQITLSS